MQQLPLFTLEYDMTMYSIFVWIAYWNGTYTLFTRDPRKARNIIMMFPHLTKVVERNGY